VTVAEAPIGQPVPMVRADLVRSFDVVQLDGAVWIVTTVARCPGGCCMIELDGVRWVSLEPAAPVRLIALS
jgi:hypothetical protein